VTLLRGYKKEDAKRERRKEIYSSLWQVSTKRFLSFSSPSRSRRNKLWDAGWLWLAEKFWSLYCYEEILRRGVSPRRPFHSRRVKDTTAIAPRKRQSVLLMHEWNQALPRDFTIDQNYLDADKSPTSESLASHLIDASIILLKIHEISFAKICRLREFANVRKLQCSAIRKIQ